MNKSVFIVAALALALNACGDNGKGAAATDSAKASQDAAKASADKAVADSKDASMKAQPASKDAMKK